MVSELVIGSWADNTKSTYNSYFKLWFKYCQSMGIPDPYAASVEEGAEFLAHMNKKLGYPHGTCAVARSALSAILQKQDGKIFSDHPLVARVMKGIFKAAPSLPRVHVTWDPEILLKYIDSLPNNNELLLEQLTKKLCTLLALLSGTRAQAIGNLDLKFYHLDPSQKQLMFYIPKVLKNTKPNHHQPPLEFWAFSDNDKWCPIKCFVEYLERTCHIRENSCPGEHQLIISYSEPYQPVSVATITRYVRLFLGQAGIDRVAFTAKSTRKSSTSKACSLGLPLKEIIKAGGWTNPHTFQRFYNFPIRKNFGQTLLIN